ncbi:hypothetical protein [Arthrobacter ramosus]|uniref:Uncharacterized protein n=1 Tax=Arthrobacter ramosus TaxID=1672 RepID=A0ABV5Y7V0_ARTRM|nr:hypothetical protein [Arthrobacter ramosus]
MTRSVTLFPGVDGTALRDLLKELPTDIADSFRTMWTNDVTASFRVRTIAVAGGGTSGLSS